jgi:hypothetical protein
MSWAVFPWVFAQYHGCEYDHGGMAMVLAEHIETVMGWTASPQDVMSGFGVEGDVANGSFEEVAPFGAWGWRYYDDHLTISRTDLTICNYPMAPTPSRQTPPPTIKPIP